MVVVGDIGCLFRMDFVWRRRDELFLDGDFLPHEFFAIEQDGDIEFAFCRLDLRRFA